MLARISIELRVSVLALGTSSESALLAAKGERGTVGATNSKSMSLTDTWTFCSPGWSSENTLEAGLRSLGCSSGRSLGVCTRRPAEDTRDRSDGAFADKPEAESDNSGECEDTFIAIGNWDGRRTCNPTALLPSADWRDILLSIDGRGGVLLLSIDERPGTTGVRGEGGSGGSTCAVFDPGRIEDRLCRITGIGDRGDAGDLGDDGGLDGDAECSDFIVAVDW